MASSGTQNEVNQVQSVGDLPSIDGHAKQRDTVSAENGATTSEKTTASESPTTRPGLHDSNTAKDAHTDTVSNSVDGEKTVTGTSILHGHGSTGDSGMADGAANGQAIQFSADAQDGGRNGNPGVDHTGLDSQLDTGIGSDTDISRADSTEQARDALDKAARSGGIKKATSFKPVSVTKTFLAKSAVGPSPVVRVGEKSPAVPSPQPVAKPRLVAKSGSGINSSPRPRVGTEGPVDGTTVWNKNRPAPPAPAKQFTDEELKQQYGIHLATRLQSDETGGKQSKWADMEDDEDDWAPETVEWMDGTKSRVNIDPTPPVVQPKPVVMQEEARPPPQTRPTLALKRPSQTGPPKTILRPGASQLNKPDNVSARSSPQPTGSQSSTPAPPPVKSPWAPLPPVEKTTPIFPPQQSQQQQQPAKFATRDAHGFDAIPPMPTHEMQADTFDRSYGELSRGPRELFNSQSGRYEPAPEHRRPSGRYDQGVRHPSLLHRGQQDVPSYPEPSAAFQTRSSHVEAGPWGRRRGSSVSGTSGSAIERRQSVSKHPDMPPPSESREGINTDYDVGSQPPAKPEMSYAQRMQEEAAQRAEEQAKQKKLMQEKRELAVKRRKEENEREEAERKERIRKKLEELGPPPTPVEKQKAPEAVEMPSSKPPQPVVQQQEQPDRAVATAPGIEQPAALSAAQAPNLEAQIDQPSRSPEQPKAVQPPSLGNTHSDPGPQPVAKPQAPVSPLPPPIQQSPFSKQQPSPRDPTRNLSAAHSVPPSSYSSPGEQKSQTAFTPVLGADSFATWGPSMTSHAGRGGNVWGPPTSRHGFGNGAIGNGAFDNGLPGFGARKSSNGILPSSGSFAQQQQFNHGASQSFRNQDTSPMMHQQLLSDQNLVSLGLADGPTTERLAAASASVSPIGSQPKPQQLAPIAPPQRSVSKPLAQPPGMQGPQRVGDAWDSFATQEQRRLANVPDASTSHADNQGSAPVTRWNTTFKQVQRSDDWLGGPRKVLAEHKYTVERPAGVLHQSAAVPAVASPAPPVSQTQQTQPLQVNRAEQARAVRESTVKLPSGPSSFTQGHTIQTPPRASHVHMPVVQQSRFFPSVANGGSPPPEEFDHPVFSGNAKRPIVNLPAPKPQVRLPPRSPTAEGIQMQPSPVVMPPRSARAQPLVRTPDWQARFNGLFGRVHTTTATPPSPPGTPPKASGPVLEIDSLSKGTLFEQPRMAGTTVSLPRSSIAQVVEDSVTKPMVDDIFDGELSFGSTPKVSIPRHAVYSEGVAERELLQTRPHRGQDLPIHATTREQMPVFYDVSKRGMLTISLPGWKNGPKDMRFHFRSRSYQARKPSGRHAHGRRGDGDAKENTAGLSGPSSHGPTSRQSSFQKSQSAGNAQSPNPVESRASNAANVGASSPQYKGSFKKPFKTRKPSASAQNSGV
ncbi:hypothetical protein MBLNU457_5326t1 [Dothideomycetes sp. NU457]